MKGKIRSILFIGFILVLFAANILTAEKVFSNKENRYLQTLPEFSWNSLISGEFGNNFEKYTTDQFISRDNWISLKTISDLSILKKDNTRVYFGKEDYLFNVDNNLDEEQLNKNLININKFLDNIMEYNEGISIQTLLVPSKSQVLKNKLPLYAPILDENSLVEKIQSSVIDSMDILDLTDILNEKSNEDIYYKTDHHWTSKGAFYAYEYYLETIGLTPLKEGDFTITRVSDKFLGTNYRKANFYKGNPEEIHNYKPKEEITYDITINNTVKNNALYDESFLNKTDKYSYFLGGDQALIEIKTSVNNNKSILIIKDSFANSFIPFLANHYENVVVIDPRYFNSSIIDYIKEKNIEEVLFLFNTQNFVQEKAFDLFKK